MPKKIQLFQEWTVSVVVRWLIPVLKQNMLDMLHNQQLQFFNAVPFTNLCPDEFWHTFLAGQTDILILKWKKIVYIFHKL